MFSFSSSYVIVPPRILKSLLVANTNLDSSSFAVQSPPMSKSGFAGFANDTHGPGSPLKTSPLIIGPLFVTGMVSLFSAVFINRLPASSTYAVLFGFSVVLSSEPSSDNVTVAPSRSSPVLPPLLVEAGVKIVAMLSSVSGSVSKSTGLLFHCLRPNAQPVSGIGLRVIALGGNSVNRIYLTRATVPS